MVPVANDPMTHLVMFALKAGAIGGMTAGSLHVVHRHMKRQETYPKLHNTPAGKRKDNYSKQLALDKEGSVTAFALGSAFGSLLTIPMLVQIGGAPFVQALQAAAIATGAFSPLYGIVATGNHHVIAKNPVKTALAVSALGGGVGAAALTGSAMLKSTALASMLREVGTASLASTMAYDTYALMVHATNPVISPKAMIAEFIGTGALVFIGAGAGALGTASLLGVAMAHGLTLACFAYAYGHISGVHVNPAVTFGFLAAGRYDALGLEGEEHNLKEGATCAIVNYLLPQAAGSIAAAGLLKFCISGFKTNLGATALASQVSWIQGFTLETLMTFFLMNTILHTTDEYGAAGGMAPWAIGSTLTFCILMDGPLTGASLNPCRTLGPNLWAGKLFNSANSIIYFTAPFLGAGIASGVWSVLAKMQKPRDKVAIEDGPDDNQKEKDDVDPADAIEPVKDVE